MWVWCLLGLALFGLCDFGGLVFSSLWLLMMRGFVRLLSCLVWAVAVSKLLMRVIYIGSVFRYVYFFSFVFCWDYLVDVGAY